MDTPVNSPEVPPRIYQALSAVFTDIKYVPKDSINEQQRFKFRGIDAILIAVNPVFAKHRIIISAIDIEDRQETITTSKGTPMSHVTMKVLYQILCLTDGSHIEGFAFGEAMDVGDKAYTKAQSVALRTFIINTFAIPSGDPDPDSSTYERGDEKVVERPKPEVKPEPPKGPTPEELVAATAYIDQVALIESEEELKVFYDSALVKPFHDIAVGKRTIKSAVNQRLQAIREGGA